MSRTRYKVFVEDNSPYFITATTVNWLPLFNKPEIAQIVIDSLRFLQENKRIIIYSYVLMKDHLHLIASAERLAKQIGNFKSYTARQSIDFYKRQKNNSILKQLMENKLAHRSDRTYQFWQEGIHPKRIHDETMMYQKIEYIHYNPVKKGYVNSSEDWQYSSACNYAGISVVLGICTEW